MVELEALGGMGRGERQRRVVAAQLGESRRGSRAMAAANAGEVGVADRPAEECRRDRARRRGRRRSAARTRPRRMSSGSPSSAPLARRAPAGRRPAASRRGARSAAPGTAAPSRSATTTAGRSSRFVRARTARVDPSSGHVRDRPLEADGLVRRVRREDEPAGRRRPGPDRLREPLAVVLDETDGPLDDLARAAVVDLEVDPAQAGQQRPRGPGSAARRRAASHRSTGRRRRRGRSGWPARRAAGPAGAGRDRRPGPRRRAGACSDRASGRASPDRARARRSRAATRSSKSRPPLAATAAS